MRTRDQVVDRLREMVDEACGLQPADLSADALCSMLERKMTDLRMEATRHRDMETAMADLRVREAQAEAALHLGMLREALRLSERDATVGKRWRQRALDAEALLRRVREEHAAAPAECAGHPFCAGQGVSDGLAGAIVVHLDAAADSDSRRW